MEDEDDRSQPEQRGEHGDRDLLADRVGGHDRRGRVPANTFTSSACCTPAPPGREGNRAGDLVDAEHEQHVLHRAADAERVEQEPEGREAAHPRRRLPGGDLAQVAGTVVEDRHALADARPEGLHAHRQQREREQAGHRQRGDQEQREAEVLGQVGDVERVQLGEVRRLREDALAESEDQHEHPHGDVEDRLHEERRGDGRVARPRNRGARRGTA